MHHHDSLLSREQSRAIDAAAIANLGMSGLLLMENASRGVCEILEKEFSVTNLTKKFSTVKKQHGRRFTLEQHRILHEVVKASRTFSIEDIVKELDPETSGRHRVSRATVFRTIHTLAEAGLVTFNPEKLTAKMNFGRAFIICGPGNNGGDGIALMRHCHSRGLPAKLFLVRGDKSLSPDAAANLDFLTHAGMEFCELTTQTQMSELQDLETDDVVVDCLLGTGAKGAPRQPFQSAIQSINKSPARVLSVDVPSGLDCDTGTAEGDCVKAHQTVTFVGMKRGFQQPSSHEFTGEISIAHIGIPQLWIHNWLAKNPST